MGLFHIDYSKPGPGVDPNEPRKTGIKRVWEIISRDFTSLFMAGLIAFACALPFLTFMVLAMSTHALLFVFLAGIVGGAIAAPALCGLSDTVLRALRDEPGYWWATYRRSWGRNWKASILPGMLFALLFSMDIFLFAHIDTSQRTYLILLMIGFVLVVFLALYMLAQVPLFNLSFLGMMRNAALLSLAQPLRTLAAAVVLIGHTIFVVLYYPLTTIEMLFIGSWFPVLWALFLVYPAIEKSFDLEANIKALHEKEFEEYEADVEEPAGEDKPEQ